EAVSVIKRTSVSLIRQCNDFKFATTNDQNIAIITISTITETFIP
ncbi:15408_t:CDS:1, partial [Gigaspora margarita]